MTKIRHLAAAAALGTFGFADEALAQSGNAADQSGGRYRLFEGFVQGVGTSSELKVPIMIDTVSGRTWVLKPAVDGQLRWSRILLERLGAVPDGLLPLPPDVTR